MNVKYIMYIINKAPSLSTLEQNVLVACAQSHGSATIWWNKADSSSTSFDANFALGDRWKDLRV